LTFCGAIKTSNHANPTKSRQAEACPTKNEAAQAFYPECCEGQPVELSPRKKEPFADSQFPQHKIPQAKAYATKNQPPYAAVQGKPVTGRDSRITIHNSRITAL
jgi:hypothetical protein